MALLINRASATHLHGLGRSLGTPMPHPPPTGTPGAFDDQGDNWRLLRIPGRKPNREASGMNRGQNRPLKPFGPKRSALMYGSTVKPRHKLLGRLERAEGIGSKWRPSGIPSSFTSCLSSADRHLAAPGPSAPPAGLFAWAQVRCWATSIALVA